MQQECADFGGSEFVAIAEGSFQTDVAEFFIVVIASFDDAVGQEDEDVARLGFDLFLVVGGVGEQAEGDADGVDDFHLAVSDENGTRQSRIGDAQDAALVVPGAVRESDVAIVDGALHESLIDRAQHLGRRELAFHQRADNATDQSGVKGSGRALAGDITENADVELGFRIEAEVVHVAGDNARGAGEAGDACIVQRRRAMGLEALLQLAREVKVLIELALLATDAVVENCVFQRDGEL